MRGYVKAILCLAVLSFVFGAVSQIAAVTGEDIIPVEFQGVAGLALASATAFVLSRKRSAPSAGAFYNMLFPVVAAMLVSLPFITVPAINMAATVLVFVAYYMASLNVRVIVCELASQEHASVKLHLGLVLGISRLPHAGGRRLRSNGPKRQRLNCGAFWRIACITFCLIYDLHPAFPHGLARRHRTRIGFSAF